MIREIDAVELPRFEGRGLHAALAGAHGLLIRNYFSAREAAEMARHVRANRAHWRSFRSNGYRAFGAPFYGYLSDVRPPQEYFADAAASNALIARLMPRLSSAMVRPIALIEAPARVRKRPQWGGPGFVIQDGRSRHAPHFDLSEGILSTTKRGGPGIERATVRRLRALFARSRRQDFVFTCIAMVQPPRSGGGLFVWDRPFEIDGGSMPRQMARALERPPHRVEYGIGSLLVLNGLSLHEVEASRGQRITVNMHVLRAGPGRLEYWF